MVGSHSKRSTVADLLHFCRILLRYYHPAMSIETKTTDSSSVKKEKYDVEELSAGPASPQDDLANIDEKKLIRKIDFVLIPWLSFLYLVAFLDRTSIGNAKVRRKPESMFPRSQRFRCSCITWSPTSTFQTINTYFACLYSLFHMRFST